jgi:hypothetical protein
MYISVFKAGEPDEASDAKRACTDNEDNKCFFLSNFILCSNQSNHRTEIDCLSFQQETAWKRARGQIIFMHININQ